MIGFKEVLINIYQDIIGLFKTGWDKMAPIAAQQQAKFYLPRQAAAASARVLRLLQYTSRSTHADYIPAHVLRLVYCGNATFKCKII